MSITACKDCELEERIDNMSTALMVQAERLHEVDVKATVTSELLKGFKESFDRLENLHRETVKTITENTNMLIKMQEEIRGSKEETSRLNQRVSGIEKRFLDAEELSKVDLRKILQGKASWLIGGGFITIILSICGIFYQLILNLDKITTFLNGVFTPYMK